ncbi:hypothetical protein OIU78_002500 [Salix suchowensis]|nr:hypothetical protein OIU78_002500 [Salix suchowensis]
MKAAAMGTAYPSWSGFVTANHLMCKDDRSSFKLCLKFWFAPHDHKVGSSSIMEEISMRPHQFRVKLADFQQTATCSKHPGGSDQGETRS